MSSAGAVEQNGGIGASVGAGMGAWGGLPANLGDAPTEVLGLYLRLLPASFFAQLRAKEKQRRNNRVYTDAVVIWLMMVQRWSGNGTLEMAVLELMRGLPKDFWPRPCKRLQPSPGEAKRVSGNTTSYSNARQQLPETILQESVDWAFQQLHQSAERGQTARPPAYFLDGSSVRTAHSEELRTTYPPGSNQHGEAHWPVLRILVAHDLYTGLAMRPEWGPMYGAQAVSEQSLLEPAIGRLPAGAVVVGDANFGVFSVAYTAAQRHHPMVLRLTAARARHLAGEELRDGIDRTIQWKPSRDDRRAHPELPAEASVSGRLLVRQVQPSNGAEAFLLALFTTMEGTPEEQLELYGYRWNIETDLRTLKSTLQMEQLTCTTPEMVGKEITAAVLAYNLIRAVIWLAAERAGLKPRQFSFTRTQNILRAFLPLIAAAGDRREAQQLFDKMMYYAGQAKLPRRNRKRPSSPRAVWSKPRTYPKRKE